MAFMNELKQHRERLIQTTSLRAVKSACSVALRHRLPTVTVKAPQTPQTLRTALTQIGIIYNQLFRIAHI
jgi:hypothetical protein